MLNRVRSLIAVLVLGLPGFAIAQPTAAKPAVKVDPTTTFLKQEKYTYCDVKILAEYWKTSAKEAKATAGSKLQANAENVLEDALNKGRAATKLKCSYLEGGFTFKDVQKLSKLWHLSIAEAKSTIELKLMHGTSIYLKDEIRNSAAQENDPYSVFSAQTKYTYCDARMVGALWGQSLAEGKKAIGQKLVAKNKRGLTKLIADARKNAKKNEDARCSYYDAGMSYDDLVILAKLWKKPEGEMKALVSEKIANGLEASILAQLKAEKKKHPPAVKPAPTPPPPPDRAATKQETAPTKQAIPKGAPPPATPPPGADSVTTKPTPLPKPAGTK